MRKNIFYITVFYVFFNLTRFVFADTNIIKLPDTAHNNIHTLNYSLAGGISSYAYDEDFTSGYGSNNSRSDGGYELDVISEHIFPKEVNLSKIYYRLNASASANGNYTRTHNFYMYVEYLTDGVWYVLPGSKFEGGGGEGDSGYDTGQVTYTASINNVQGLRATVHSYGLATGGEGTAKANGWIYELQGWGAVDVGLRAYDGVGVIKIACEPAGVLNSPLRIHKNGTTYSIILVDSTDARASKIRIKTNTGVKALAKFN